jgi:hypothetical protein
MSIRRVVSWAAIYAIALQTILVGILPLTDRSSIGGDTFSVICRSDNPYFAFNDIFPGGNDDLVGHDCHHCALCNASVSPNPPETFIAAVLPLVAAHVFQQLLCPPTLGVTSNPKLARGPPQTVLT